MINLSIQYPKSSWGSVRLAVCVQLTLIPLKGQQSGQFSKHKPWAMYRILAGRS